MNTEGKDLKDLIRSFHLREKCKYCLKEFVTVDNMEDTVWTGKHSHGYLAHKKCWDENNLQENK